MDQKIFMLSLKPVLRARSTTCAGQQVGQSWSPSSVWWSASNGGSILSTTIVRAQAQCLLDASKRRVADNKDRGDRKDGKTNVRNLV